MNLDIRQLKNSPGQNFPFDWTEESEPVDHKGQPLKLTRPVHARGKALYQSGVLHIQLDLETELETECSRCLTSVRIPVKLHEFLEFIEEPKEGMNHVLIEEYSFEHGLDEMDLLPYATKLAISSLDIKPLCRPDCQGLCPTCGKDLNQGICKCALAAEKGDPRLKRLKELLSSQE
ncbi:DUF177 domain-containing protein [Candidatus Acetothermia bacterium]|nr:DUF177 domain-containing protein [Candidatus Acetothermia bacterium]MBI3642994.1 DUF177 domain-containing protein [Candidatus Acetothermia bacterium]